MEIKSASFVEEKVGGELAVSPKKATDLVAKAKEFLGNSKKEFKELQDELEQYCVFTLGEHYTSDQLKAIIESVRVELEPAMEPVEEPAPVIKASILEGPLQ